MTLVILDDAIVRIEALADLMRWDFRFAFGTVGELWRRSQAVGAHEGTREDILIWCREPKKSLHEKLFASLLHPRCKFIIPTDVHDVYSICGTKRHIERKARNQQHAAQMAEKRWQKRKASLDAGSNATGNADADAAGNAQARPGRARPGQAEPSQAEPGQAKTLDGQTDRQRVSLPAASPPARVKEPTDGSKVWQAYAEAYARRYRGQPPVRNAKANALCSQLVARVGAQDAAAVAAFYVTHNGNWYVQKLHMLEYAVKDAEALVTQMRANHRVTASEAQQQDRSQDLDQTFSTVFAHLGEKYNENGRPK